MDGWFIEGRAMVMKVGGWMLERVVRVGGGWDGLQAGSIIFREIRDEK